MQITRRNFLASGIGLLGTTIASPRNLFTNDQLILDQEFINRIKGKIEKEILPVMGKIYLPDREIFDDNYYPGLKYIEKIVNYYDYQACGISVLASLAAGGNPHAIELIKRVQKNIRYYQEKIFKTEIEGSFWNVPLRRLLLHIALAYKKMESVLSGDDKQWYQDMINQQVQLAIEHNKNFFPGEHALNKTTTNNHAAIFMQGIYYCGKIFNRPEWVDLCLDFAQRLYESVQPDGYYEENTNEAHEGGPSMVYTRLTLGCLYDILDGKRKPVEKFIQAGKFYRSFVNYDYQMISIADERTNCHTEKGIDYGLAIHSLTSQGRYFIVDNLKSLDFSLLSVEELAVIYHELDLMQLGDCKTPENRLDGPSRITLPLGVIRSNGFTAGISALLALNRIIRPNAQYALDQQDMVYLSHKNAGLILIGYKSKHDPEYSTFRIREDAYTVKTGELEMGKNRAQAQLYYAGFKAKIRWKIKKTAKLILSSDSDELITTCLPVTDEKFIRSGSTFVTKYLNGFSPYTKNNISDKVKVVIFEWRKRLVVEFVT